MLIRVDPGSGEPLSLQISRQMRLLFAGGRLAVGDRLPGSRELAAEIGVNFHTVRKAYADLETEGLIESKPGVGTFVATARARLSRAELRRLVHGHLEQLAAALATSGRSASEVEDLLVDEWRRLTGGDRSRKGPAHEE